MNPTIRDLIAKLHASPQDEAGLVALTRELVRGGYHNDSAMHARNTRRVNDAIIAINSALDGIGATVRGIAVTEMTAQGLTALFSLTAPPGSPSGNAACDLRLTLSDSPWRSSQALEGEDIDAALIIVTVKDWVTSLEAKAMRQIRCIIASQPPAVRLDKITEGINEAVSAAIAELTRAIYAAAETQGLAP